MTDFRADLARMPRYKCHKVVHALKIGSVEYQSGGGVRLSFIEPGYEPLFLKSEYTKRCTPQAGGYFVVYQDGYQSYSPAPAFEEGYTRLPAGA